jgi:CRP/FNR family transcriptional regulator, cyclic AMP receptor protein
MGKDYSYIELDGCDIFSTLKAPDQERLKSLFRLRSFRKNELIFLKGDPGFGLYLIRQGRVKICVVDREGRELIFTFLVKGDLLGELAIFDGKPRSATAIAVEDTDTLYLDREDFLILLNNSPQICLDIINMLCQRLRRLSNQLEEKSFLDVAGRISRHLLSMANSNPPSMANSGRAASSLTQEELARVIGASREMVNKILNSFVDMHLISIARKKLIILNSNELSRIANYDEAN